MINPIVDIFNQVPSERVYIQNKSEDVTYGYINRSINQFSEDYSYLDGKNCALVTSSRFELAKVLPLIASVANKVFLQPKCLKEDVEKEFYEKSGIEYVINVSESGICTSKISDVNAPKKQEWLLSTSGTTGSPKLISYNLASLMKTSKKDISKGGNFKWGLCYDLNRFAGLQVYFQAIASGSSLTISESSDELSDSVKLFIDKNVNCLSATPSFWRKVLMTKGSKLLGLKRITLGGEISDQAVLNSLKKYYENSHIVHIYASTEAGVGFSVKDGLAGFPVDYLEPSSSNSVILKIINDILWIKSDRASTGIINGKIETDDDGFINTGDIVEVKDSRILFLGRDSGTINVGGNKVIPEEIEAVLNSHSKVMQSRVFGKKNPVLGMLVNAEIISNKTLAIDEEKKFKKELFAFCNGKLEPFKIPAMLKFVECIAINESGKIVRKQ
ncbi:acyl--CoA ligase [Colwellia sp. BRX8-4]|nr:acyl--CoA ligase [Colwellia sp. BRX8-4]